MSYVSTLQDVRGGALLVRLDEELAALVEAIEETGKKGAITLKLNIKKNGEGAVTVSPEVKTDIPSNPVGDALFFIDGSSLSRRNPEQMDIEDELQAKRQERELN
ncbi:MAG: hypothetical protein AAFW60_02885 [Pseudomonadota bacterium]